MFVYMQHVTTATILEMRFGCTNIGPKTSSANLLHDSAACLPACLPANDHSQSTSGLARMLCVMVTVAPRTH